MTSYEKQKEGTRRAIAYKPAPSAIFMFCGGADHCLDYHTSFTVSPYIAGSFFFSLFHFFFFMLVMNEDWMEWNAGLFFLSLAVGN